MSCLNKEQKYPNKLEKSFGDEDPHIEYDEFLAKLADHSACWKDSEMKIFKIPS